MVNLGKLKIHSSFFFFVIVVIALGQIKQFIFLVAATTLHELSHVAAAKLYGLKTESLIVTPIGETAYIDGFDALPARKKNIILLAGPLTNIFSFVLVFPLKGVGLAAHFESFMYISLAIGMFNLLPIYPFDGGKLAFIFLGNRLGILRSVKHIRFLTKTGICLLFFTGFIQIALFPLNFSLLAIAGFLLSIYEREKKSMVFSYYKCMLYKRSRLAAGLSTKTTSANTESAAADIEKLFTWDFFHIINVAKDGKIIATLTETQVFEAASKTQAQIKLIDIIEKDVV